MPQLLPFYFLNQLFFSFVTLLTLVYILSKFVTGVLQSRYRVTCSYNKIQWVKTIERLNWVIGILNNWGEIIIVLK